MEMKELKVENALLEKINHDIPGHDGNQIRSPNTMLSENEIS